MNLLNYIFVNNSYDFELYNNNKKEKSSKGVSAKNVIKTFFNEYLESIKKLSSNNNKNIFNSSTNEICRDSKIHNNSDDEFNEEKYKIIIKVLPLTPDVIQYINAFYFQYRKDIYLELIKICPKLLYYK